MSKIKKYKAPLIEIKQRPGSTGCSAGANTQVFLDGKPLGGVVSVTLKASARKISKVTMTMIGNVKVKGKFNYVLGKYSPVSTNKSTKKKGKK